MDKVPGAARPAGSGFILPSQTPIKRGMWNLYETTNPRIGVFEVSLWVELEDEVPHDHSEIDLALKELATFIRDNIKENIVVLEFGHSLIMGGYGNGERAGRNFLKNGKRESDNSYFATGYEIRMMQADAVTFMALWQGHEYNQ